MVINIDPVLLYIGSVPVVRWYGLMYVVGFLAGLSICIPFARTRGITEDDVWAVFWPAVVLGLLGARLYYVAQQDLGPYMAQPWRIFATWEGGMAFYGAVVGAAIALVVVARQRKVSVWRMLDAGAFFAIVAQAFGRVGNIINGDVLGYPTDLPWGFIYLHPNSFVPEKGVAYQPAAVYELIFNILLFIVLWRIKDRLRRPGTIFATWLVVYSVGQLLIFTQRMNDIVFMGLKQAQVTALVVLVICIPLVWYLQGRESSEAERQATPAADNEGEAF